MHEFTLAEATLDLVLERARKNQAKQIHAITVRIGDLSGVDVDAFEFAFGVVAADSLAASARLQIDRIPVTCRCTGCQSDFVTSDMDLRCPLCQSVSREIIGGRELDLASVEVS